VRFILVDEILELVPGKFVKAVKTFSPSEELFRDHFPGFPVVPGVLLTEMMAQAAGKCLNAEGTARGLAMLAQVKSAAFRDWVLPGQTSSIFCEIGSSRSQYATASGRIEVEGRKVCSADLMFAFVPASRFDAGYRDEVLDRYLLSHR
jgi:3-hydroxyacyl-[acyl-carrier-protein] dehydratase